MHLPNLDGPLENATGSEMHAYRPEFSSDAAVGSYRMRTRVLSQGDEEAQGRAHSRGSENDFTDIASGPLTLPVSGVNEALTAPQNGEIAARWAFKEEERRLLACLSTPALISYIPLPQQEAGWPELDFEKSFGIAVSGFLSKPFH